LKRGRRIAAQRARSGGDVDCRAFCLRVQRAVTDEVRFKLAAQSPSGQSV
jgi:hypothetical protein